jgi:hypothetical protein
MSQKQTPLPLYFRALVFQPTGHIVWCHREPSPWQSIPRRIPNISKDLDYKLYIGDPPTDFNWFDEFKKYRLIKSKEGLNNLKLGNLPTEYVDEVKLLRAKCYSLWTVINSVAYSREKLDAINNPILTANTEDLVKLYQRIHNLNETDARKLVKFKKEEIESDLSRLSLIEIEAEACLLKATTVEEVLAQNQLNCTWLATHSTDLSRYL